MRLENSSHEDSTNHTDDYDRSKDTKHRADIIVDNIQNGNIILVDLQVTEPTSDHRKPHIHVSQSANESPAIKMQKYV